MGKVQRASKPFVFFILKGDAPAVRGDSPGPCFEGSSCSKPEVLEIGWYESGSGSGDATLENPACAWGRWKRPCRIEGPGAWPCGVGGWCQNQCRRGRPTSNDEGSGDARNGRTSIRAYRRPDLKGGLGFLGLLRRCPGQKAVYGDPQIDSGAWFKSARRLAS